jgi:hypothetical protein
MQKQHIPQGLQIDFCQTHGVWLDVGELEAIMRQQTAAAPNVAPPATEGSSFGATVGRVGAQFGHSMVAGAGASLGHRIVGGIVDSIFGRR